MVCIAVCAIAEDSPISDETGPAAEGVCSIGILMFVLCMDVFTAVEELWEGFEMAKGYVLGCLSWLLYAASSATRTWEESIYLYNPGHLGLIDEVKADWLFPPFTGERCGCVFLYYLYID